MPAQLQAWITSAATWVEENSTEVVYIGAVLAAFLLLGGTKRR